MELNPGAIDELLGAWALDALDLDVSAAIDEALAGDPALAARAAELRRAAAALGEMVAARPPADLRDRIMSRADELPPALRQPNPPSVVFANQVAMLRELVGGLTADELAEPALPYRWTVHGLLAHLLVVERYTAGQLGLTDPVGGRDAGHLELGADEIAAELRRSGAATAEEWHRVATTTIAALEAGAGPAMDAPVELHRWPMTTAGALIARSFEVWTHADDIRRATGRPTVAPHPSDVRAMSQFSVASLPLVLPLVAPGEELGGARVVLTGDGGGTFDLGDPRRRDALFVADVVDYCRVAARRIDVADLPMTVEGDRPTVERLLAASRVFAL